MGKEVESRVRTGRPFGGTGFLYNKKHSACVKPLVNYKHDRVSVVNLSTNVGNIILINGYLPYLNRRELQNYRVMYQETIAFISNVINDHPGSQFILLMDLNCNIYDSSHPYTSYVKDLLSDHSLVSIFDLMPEFDIQTSFTRCDLKTNSFSLIDGVLVSRNLCDCISVVCISDYGDNLSDHRPIEFCLDVILNEISQHKVKPQPFIHWNRLKSDEIIKFRQKMSNNLDAISFPITSLVHGDKCCSDSNHMTQIRDYYCALVDAVISSDSVLPRFNPVIHKPYWSEEISDLKRKSIDCCNKWREDGCPRSGDVYQCKRRCSLEYKKAIKAAKAEYDSRINYDLHDHLASLDNDAFWKVWRNQIKERNPLSTRVDGETSERGIAEAFRVHFQRVYSNHNTPEHESLKSQFNDKFAEYFSSHINDSIVACYLSWDDMVNVLSRVKTGKSSAGKIRPEHILYGSEKLAIHLHLLFNSMIQHGIVVEDFLNGTITPIIKDAQGDTSDSNNYRGITLGGLFSKLFEIAIDNKLTPYLKSDPLQFGFKKRTSTAHALFTLKSTTDYFNSRGSDVFVAFLDCTKAFTG